jgi:hypothetical protein
VITAIAEPVNNLAAENTAKVRVSWQCFALVKQKNATDRYTIAFCLNK